MPLNDSTVTVYDPATGMPIQASPYSAENQPDQDQMNYATTVPQTQPQTAPQTITAGRGVKVQPFENAVGPAVTEGLIPMLYGAAKGTVSGVAGAPGDINSLLRQYITPLLPDAAQNYLQNQPAPPTSEQISHNLPSLSGNVNLGPNAASSENYGDWAGRNVIAPLVTPPAAEAGKGLPVGLSIKDVSEAENLNKINMSPRITPANIKGPATQEVGAMLNQVKSVPGVTKEGLRVGAEELHALDPTTKITKEEFVSKLKHEHGFEKHDLRNAATNDDVHMRTYAEELAEPEEVLYNMGFNNHHQDILEFIHGDKPFQELHPDVQHQIKELTENGDHSRFRDLYDEERDQLVDEYIDFNREMRADLQGNGEHVNDDYANRSHQRLVKDKNEDYYHEYEDINPKHKYYEVGITHPDYTGSYKHYPNAPKGTIGHTRGTYSDEPLDLFGNVKTEPKSAVIEEIQSDAQQKNKQVGPLHQVHGTVFKGAIQHALEQGADHVYYPSAGTIKVKRGYFDMDDPKGQHLNIYDNDIMKEGVGPLMSVPGVNIEPILNNGPRANPDIPILYHKFSFTPEAKDIILNGVGQPTPGYKKGGHVHMNNGGVPPASNIPQTPAKTNPNTTDYVPKRPVDPGFAEVLERVRSAPKGGSAGVGGGGLSDTELKNKLGNRNITYNVGGKVTPDQMRYELLRKR